MTTVAAKPKRSHPWRAFNPGALARREPNDPKVVPNHAKPIR